MMMRNATVGLLTLLGVCSFGAHAVRHQKQQHILESRDGQLISAEDGVVIGSEKGLFSILVSEWKEIPDKAEFVKNCSGIVGGLLPKLRQEYTTRQVPKILMHECDNYATKNDFKTINTTLDEGKRACRNCAGRLGAEFLGNKNYNSWCEYVFDLLSREGLADHYRDLHGDYLEDIEALKKQLRQLQRDYEAAQAANGEGGAGNSSRDSKRDRETDHMKKHWDAYADLPCCPKDCKPCFENGTAMKLKEMGPPPSHNFLQHMARNKKQDMIRAIEAQAKAEVEAEDQKAMGFFHILLKEWREIPDKDQFVKNCTGIVGKLMPQLRKEYTSRQVPKIVFHECANYATKNDFKTVNTTIEEGQDTCEKCATRLGAEFLGNQNYGAWCDYVFDMMEHDMMKDHYRDLLRQHLDDIADLKGQLQDLKRKYEELKGKRLGDRRRDLIRKHYDDLKELPCCPEACRPCFDDDGNPVYGDGPEEDKKKK